MTEQLPRVSRIRLADSVAGILEQKILRHEWAPGFQLPSEPELVEQFGVSRSVVRDAVKALAARGLVDVRQGAGTVVTEPTSLAYTDAILVLLQRAEVTVGQVAEARELIETEIAGFAALRRTEEDCRQLRAVFETYRAAVDAESWAEAKPGHTALHLGVMAAVHAPALEIILLPIEEFLLGSPWPPILDDKDLWDVDLHEEILMAIEGGDRERAREAMTRHFYFRSDPLYAEPLNEIFRPYDTSRETG